MKYFEQVHRGIRAPGRALAPAICAVALCTAFLMVAAWPTTAAAAFYIIEISNFPETGSYITVKRLSFKCKNSSWKRFYPGTKQLNNNDDRSSYWKREFHTGSLCRHKFKVKWICNSHYASGYNEFVTSSAKTDKNGTRLQFTGCTNDDIHQIDHSH